MAQRPGIPQPSTALFAHTVVESTPSPQQSLPRLALTELSTVFKDPSSFSVLGGSISLLSRAPGEQLGALEQVEVLE